MNAFSLVHQFPRRVGRLLSGFCSAFGGGSVGLRAGAWGLCICLLLMVVLALYWSREPALLPNSDFASQLDRAIDQAVPVSAAVRGSVTTSSLRYVAASLLEKPGGYLSNDILPPGLLLDNIPQWEYGVLVQVRDLSKALREAFSRSQSQSTEDSDLVVAEPKFNFDNRSWLLPSSESVYREGIEKLDSYHSRLVNPAEAAAQFYARADNLRFWLGSVEKRLGSLSQRLSASVGQRRLNTDLAGEAAASQSTPAASELGVKTPWTEIDDVFYEARGTTWALVNFFRAVEIDFAEVLARKNARISLQQITRELEATQAPLYSPLILNGSGFGMLANHSLVMASYISRAHTAIIDLRDLLSQG
ncbi:MAG: DUF2333 family protein [Cellvibrionaceae bacterium]|nr:DUF2333 family protein [Cellvibrionaceae bacterium]